MSHTEEDDSRPWTDDDLSEAIRRINAGEIDLKEAENCYGISPRTITRQRAILSMRAQLNPEKAKKMKAAGSATAKKDITILRKPVEMSCTTISGVVSLLNDGTEEVKQLLNYECDLIYECKVCKSLFRSLLNFISHKRVYCCDMYSTVHAQSNENGDATVMTNPSKVEENLKAKECLKEFSSRPFRITCRKDLTTVLKRITSLSSEFIPTEPILHLQSMENTKCALQQTIKTNQSFKEPVVKLPELSSTNDKVSAVAQEESKKVDTIKLPNKRTTTVTPTTYVNEKRFKCPLCPLNYTTKKSVLRHLKSIHHKSVEKLERLKSRVQVSFVKKKNAMNASVRTSKPLPTTTTSTVKSKFSNENNVSPIAKNEQKQEKGDREKESSVCGRQLTNRSAYSSRRKNASSSDDTDSISDASASSLVPVISLTPIVAPKLAQKIEEDNNCTNKKITSMTSQSKKVGLPLRTSSPSSSKKIGIQVRMNYRKEGVNQPISTNSVPVGGYAIPSGVSMDSADSSRRSSMVSIHDDKSDMAKVDLSNGQFTRSKLAHILKTLHDKRGIKDENEDPKITGIMKKIEKNEVSIYCEDCKTTYALNDYKWNSENGVVRSYKCALNGCDFRSVCKSELLPHLSDRHPVLSENDLSKVDSIFIAESSGAPPDSGKCCCRKGTSRERSIDRKKREVTANARAISLQTVAPIKRKLNVESTEKTAKRKMVSGLKKKGNSPTVDDKTKNETTAVVLTDVNKTEVVKHLSIKTVTKVKGNSPLKKKKLALKETRKKKPFILKKTQMSVDTVASNVTIPNGLESSSDERTQITKETKVIRKPFIFKKTQMSVDTVASDVTIPNGLESSSDERTQITEETKSVRRPFILKKSQIKKTRQSVDTVASNATSPKGLESSKDEQTPITALRVARKQNLSTEETKIAPKLPKMNSLGDSTPFTLAPCTELDPATMTEENLKKSVMTIIFGKDMSDENVEADFVNTREKSPSSSSASSDSSGKEKRYGLRAGKTVSSTSNKIVIASSLPDNKDEKVLKFPILNRAKSTPR